MNKKKVIKIAIISIILIILLAISIVIGIRLDIIIEIDKKYSYTVDKSNFYTKSTFYQNGTLTVLESYNKDESYLTTLTNYYDGKLGTKTTIYKKGEELIHLMENGDNKVIIPKEKAGEASITPINAVESSGVIEKLQKAFTTNISNKILNSQECYIIESNGEEYYVDKDSGLVIKCVEKIVSEKNEINISVSDYSYQFGVVGDDNIKKPDITGYTIIE